jgi:hypothetical protein
MALVYSAVTVVRRAKDTCMMAVLMIQFSVDIDDTLGCRSKKYWC